MPNCSKLCLRLLSGRLPGVAALAILLGSGAAQAQKFAIIDMQKAVLATTDGKKAAKAIDDKFGPVKAQLDQLAKDITAKQDQFTKNRATMSPAALSAAQAEIESLTTTLKRKKEDAQQDVEEEESQQLGSIVPKLQKIINEYAAANHAVIHRKIAKALNIGLAQIAQQLGVSDHMVQKYLGQALTHCRRRMARLR